MSTSFLSDIENGRANPSLKRLTEIARGLEIPVSVLLGEFLKKEELCKLFMITPEFEELLEYIRNYSDWSDSDRKELLTYLRAKEIARKI